MPCLQRSREGQPIRADLLQARLDAGFALLRLAGTQSSGDARRALREARAACREGEQRLKELRGPDQLRFRSRFAELRQAIENSTGAKGRLPQTRARVLQMPSIHPAQKPGATL